MVRKDHLFYYLSLLCILFFGYAVITKFPGNTQVQVAIMLFVTCSYLIFGLLHQHIHHRINTKIVLEYIAIAVLAISVVLFVLLQKL